MSRPWDAERDVPVALAARLVAAQFPELAGTRVEPLGVGWDNTVHLVDGVWAFRFPRRAVALDGVRRERDLLPRLALRLSLPVPEPVHLGVPGPEFPWPFSGARVLVGAEVADADLADPDRELLAADLGAFLRGLHAPALADDLGAGLPVDPMSRADPAARAQLALPHLERLCERGLAVPEVAVAALFAEAAPLGPSPVRPVLVHGDLHARHVLVDPDRRAAGVIDWGDVALADPSVDLSLAYGGFSGAARQAFLDTYGHVDKMTELRARVLAVGLCAALADQASTSGSPRLLDEALRGLSRAIC